MALAVIADGALRLELDAIGLSNDDARWARSEGYWVDDAVVVEGDGEFTDFRVKLRPRPNAFGVRWVPPPDRNVHDERWLAPRTGRARVYHDGRVRLDLDVK
jgi:hypothetical protein